MEPTAGADNGGSFGLGLSPEEETLLEETIGIMFAMDIIFPDEDDERSIDDGESS